MNRIPFTYEVKEHLNLLRPMTNLLEIVGGYAVIKGCRVDLTAAKEYAKETASALVYFSPEGDEETKYFRKILTKDGEFKQIKIGENPKSWNVVWAWVYIPDTFKKTGKRTRGGFGCCMFRPDWRAHYDISFDGSTPNKVKITKTLNKAAMADW